MKRIFAIILSVLLLLAVLFVPVPTGTLNDGGTTVYSALTYKIVKWNKYSDSYKPYKNTSVYFIPHNFASINDLWQKETEKLDGEEYGDFSFTAIVTEEWGDNGSFLIKDISTNGTAGNTVLSDSDNAKIIKNGEKASFSEIKVGDRIKITYDGTVLYTYPSTLGRVYEIEILQ